MGFRFYKVRDVYAAVTWTGSNLSEIQEFLNYLNGSLHPFYQDFSAKSATASGSTLTVSWSHPSTGSTTIPGGIGSNSVLWEGLNHAGHVNPAWVVYGGGHDPDFKNGYAEVYPSVTA